MMCNACEEGRHWECCMATWCECECDGDASLGIPDFPIEPTHSHKQGNEEGK